MSKSASPTWIIPAVLMLASTVGMLATDLYVPSLPTLTEVFATSPEIIQLTMTLNLAGFAVGQLFFGPLSDRFGRRTAMLLGLALFALGGVVAAMAESMATLIAGRALQGCGAIAGVAMALAADLTRPERRPLPA